MDFKRPKVIPSKSIEVITGCGKLYMTLGYEEEDGRLIEVRATIGKGKDESIIGVCPAIQLDTICKMISIILQSDMPRYKIVQKFKKNFVEMSCGNPFIFEERNYTGCHDYLIKAVLKEVEKQIK